METHAKDIEELALPGTEFTTVYDVGQVVDAAVAYRIEKRVRREKRYWDTLRKNRRHHAKVRFWSRGTNPKQLKRPVY